MTPVQRRLAFEKEAELAAERLHAARPEVQARERLDAVEEAARRARVVRRWAKDRFGDTVTCTLGPGWAYNAAARGPLAEIRFRLAREEHRALALPLDGREASLGLWVSLSATGRSLHVCRTEPRAGHREDCLRLAAPFDALTQGMTWEVILPGYLRAPLNCAYGAGSPVRVAR